VSSQPPRLSLYERIRRRLVPRRLYLWDKLRREMAHGEPEMRLIPMLARPDRLSVDVGAFKGVYSYALSKHSATVHAFEANPSMYAMLAANVSGFGGRIVTHHLALSNAAGEAMLRIPTKGGGHVHSRASLSGIAVPQGFDAVSVRTARLDDLGLTNVGFIKIDAEGMEQSILEGAATILRRDRPNLLIELEEEHRHEPLPQMVRAICAFGYDCLALLDGVLTPFERIDLERHHRHPPTKRDYIFNFVFLPKAGAGG
jgi:FkbM family methyltransferase